MVDALEKAVDLALTFALGLTLMEIVAASIRQEVDWPSPELLPKKCHGSVKRSLFHQFGHIVSEFALAGAVSFPGRLMMLSVRDLPGEIRDEQSRVKEPSNGVIQRFGGRK